MPNTLFGFLEESTNTTNPHDTAWVEDSFIFESAVGRQVGTPQSRWHVGNSLKQKNMLVFTILCIVCVLLIFLRLGNLQIVHGSDYRAIAESNRERTQPIPAERGLIFDRHGVALTSNIPSFSLALIPQDLPRNTKERQAMVARLSQITGIDETQLQQTITNYGSYSYKSIVIKENLDYKTALSIHIGIADLPGVYIERGSKRLYIHDFSPGSVEQKPFLTNSLSHILGYEGKLTVADQANPEFSNYEISDTVGKTGIEQTYEKQLRGIYGSERVEVNVLGKQQQILSETPPTPGNYVTLAIDAKVQTTLENLLSKALHSYGKERAAAIALDPRTGEILALVNLPTFDDNDFSGGISSTLYHAYIANPDHPLFNRAIGGTYPSGSSVKPAIAAIALEQHIITPKTSILSSGGLQVGPWFFPDWQTGGHGNTDVRKSLAFSVNTFYYYIGGGYKNFQGLGIDQLSTGLQRFGFGERLGIDIPGEQDGFVPNPEWKKFAKKENWYIGDTYNLSIGQGDFLVTPLQIAMMTAAIANGGTLYEPHIVRSITDPVTKAEKKITPTVLRKGVISDSYLSTVRLGMRDCVTVGSCQYLSHLPFAAAGKTGTAEWNNTKNTHAWFTSFGPFDHPEIVLTILIEEGGEGGIVSAPVARDFYAWWWKYTHST